MSGQDYPKYKWTVTGIPLDKGEQAPVRREVESWFRSTEEIDKDQVNLFVLGMKEFQEKLENDPNSYFMIAGIHGLPENTVLDGQKYQTGNYCCMAQSFSHLGIDHLWLCLRRLWDIINDIAGRYKDSEEKARYQKAAKSWRLPFWDPALISDQYCYNGVGIPSLITFPFRDVYTPETGWETIKNPFYSYVYHTGKDARRNEMFYTYTDDNGKLVTVSYTQLVTTVRQPYATSFGQFNNSALDPTPADEWQKVQIWIDQNHPSGNQNNYQIVQQFRNDSAMRNNVYRALTENHNYVSFATANRNIDRPAGVSLEGIHNTIHNYTGGVGQMGDVPVAAFDPIFWLHHCNIERWYAIWQKLNPDAWWDANDVKPKNPNNPPDKLPNEPLFPFHNAKGEPWTPDTVRSIEKAGFGYTYEELSLDDEALTHKLGELYHSLAVHLRKPTVAKRMLNGEVPKEINLTPEQPNPDKSKLIKQHLQNAKLADDTKLYYDIYKAVVNFERFALDGIPFVVHFFLGEFDKEDSYSWDQAPHRLGTIFNFVARSERGGAGEACENCVRQKESGQVVTAELDLTQEILQALLNPLFETKFGSLLNRKGVVEFLRENLHWRVTLVNGTDIPRPKIPSLEVGVFRKQARIFAGKHRHEPPVYNDLEWTQLWDVTKNRVGGATDA